MRARPSRSVAGLALALGLLGVAGCGDDGGDETSGSSLIPPTSTEAETSSTTTTTTASTLPPTTAPSRPTTFAPDARAAVDQFKGAWEAGDQVAARAIAPGEVVDALFAVPPDGYEVQGCDTGEFETSGCTFRNRATEAFISVIAQRTDAGWQIASIDVNAD